MKIKIALIIDVLEDIKGGAERQLFELIKGIDKDRFEVFLFILHQNSIPKDIVDLNVNTQALKIKRIYDFKGIYKGFRFTQFLKKEKVRILMTYHFGSDIWGTVFGKLSRVPVIVSNRRDEGFWRKKYHILAYKLVNRWVDKVIVVSEAVKAMVLRDEKVDSEKVEIIYNGVDVERFSKAQICTDLGLLAGAKVITCVGNLRPVKGHRYLVEAAVVIIAKFPQAHFLLVGDGELRSELIRLTQQLKIENNVHFLGKRDDVPSILAATDICVLPSLSEGLSNTLLEYMASGKPVIATRVGGNIEVIRNEENGILIPVKDSQALAYQVIRLLTDGALANALAQNARVDVKERFNLQKQISYTETSLKEALEEKEKIKILHLISSIGLFGAEKVLLSLADCGNKFGLKSFAGAIKNLHNPHLEIIEEAKKLSLNSVVFESRGRFDLVAIFRIARFLKENNIDIIHTHNYKSDILGMFAAFMTGSKWIATNHVWHGFDRKLRFYERLDAFILRFAERAVAVSDEIQQDLIKKGIPQIKIKVINNGINIQQFNPAGSNNGLRRSLGVNDTDVLVTNISRLSPEKGHEALLKAAKEITAKNAQVKFLIVGDGQLLQKLKSNAQDSGLDGKVIFTGIRRDISDILRVSDIYVNSSFIEGLPITILEAMAAQLPVVATKVGAVPKVIKNEVNGILVEIGDIRGLSEAILSLAGHAEMRKALAMQAYSDVSSDFSVERMCREYRQIYQELLS